MFMNYLLRSKDIIGQINDLSYGVTDFRKRLYWKSFVKVSCQLPSLVEQQKIASILTTQDKLISLQEQKVESLKKLKKAYLEKMFPKKGSRYPELRFKGFTDAWKQRKLSEILEIATRKNGNQYTKQDVLSVSDEFGCVNQIRFQGRSFAGEDISNYKVVETGDIIYTRSPLQAKPFGIIKIVAEETGIISPLYIVNVTTEGNDSKFIYYCFDTPQKTNNYLSPLVRKGVKNTMNISNDEWLSGEIMVSPYYEEQKRIAEFLTSVDGLITLHQRKLEAEKKKKKALMQLLLTGKVRCVND
ncbi:restriction endonuclease subunit S [Ruminococcus sp. HUN007]|uniref:restriction endonuclease subunit S n=1 Tax=Ruminococcus sp. HUN007 TaxID=1514668 RepID=UPI0018CC28AA|nr:restriction endonuclease subunit S [Ruminococcus sp. HUN007]